MSTINNTKQRILESAQTLLHEHNYADVGVAEICSAAGVKKGSFYHFFPSKRDLTLAVLDSTFELIKAEILSKAFTAKLPPMERLQRFTELNYQFQHDMYKNIGVVPGCQFANLAAEQATQDEVLRIKIANVFARIQEAIKDTLQDAISNGDIGNINTDATAAAMFAYLEGVILTAKTRNDPKVLKQLLPAMLDIRIN